MSEIETPRTQDRIGKSQKDSDAPLACLTAPLRLVGSLTLGILLLSILLVCMAFGTFVESEYGDDVSQFVIYANPWFHGIIALLAINIAFSVLVRLFWMKRYYPFLITHIGILLLLFGCYLTWQQGKEAKITLPEGTVGNVAVKTKQQQLEFTCIAHNSTNALQPSRFPLRLGPFSWRDYHYDNWIKDNRWYKTILWYAMHSGSRTIGEYKVPIDNKEDITIDILDYYANSVLEPVPPFDVQILWSKKTVQTVTELGETKETPRSQEPVRLDLRSRHFMPGLSDVRGVSATMSQEERVSFSLAMSSEELIAFQKSRPQGGNQAGLWGEIVLYYGGNHYSVNVDHLIRLTENQRFAVGDSGLQIGNVLFRDRGPIISFSVFTQGGKWETMTLFPDNPELNRQAREIGIFGSYWIDPQRIMRESVDHAESPVLQRMAIQRLDFMQGTDKKLYYRLWSGQKIVADGVAPDQGGQTKPKFKVAEQTPDEAEITIDRFIRQDVPGHRIVSALTGKGQYNEQRLQLRVLFDGKEDTFWIRAVVPTIVPLPPEQDQVRYIYGNNRTLCVQLNSETIDLGFGILLKQFEARTEPGTRMPSYYSSLVDYVEPINPADTDSRNLKNYQVLPGGENILISMNRPGYFFSGTTGHGYRIYQSSYTGPYYPDHPWFNALYDGTIFPWETRPRESIAMSTLSVNADPGRGWKYFGSLLTVLGSALFVWRRRY